MAYNPDKRDHSRGTEPEKFSDPKIVEVHTQLAREKEEPHEGFSGVPIIVIFVFCALGFVGSAYLARPENNGGGFRGDVYENVDPDAKKDTGPAGPKDVAAQIKDGEKLYIQQCSTCHQANGQGVAGSFPPLAKSPWVHGDPARVIKIANYGIAGDIDVEGHHYNGAMPDIGAGLSDQKLADLLTYVRQAWGNTADPIDVDTVKEVRAATPKRGQWSPGEILKIHPLETK